MNQQLLFFFSALGAFNGVIVGLYFLFFSKYRHVSNFFLGSLILVLSLRVGKSVFYFFTDSLPDIYILFGLLACWLIGPFLYFYVKSAISNTENIKKIALITFAPLILIAIVTMILYPWSANLELWKNHLVKAIYVQWLLFVILAGVEIYLHRRRVFIDSKNKNFKIWLLTLYFGNLLICIVFNLHSYTPYIIGALSFSFVFYVLALLLVFYKKKENLLYLESKKYQSNRIDSDEANIIKKRLNSLMHDEKIYLNSSLNSAKLAKLVQVSPVKLSQTFNEYLGKSFNDFVNSYRIDAAKQMIISEKNLTLEAIGLDSGFNSKSTFYTAFKKHTGITPSQFRKKNLQDIWLE